MFLGNGFSLRLVHQSHARYDRRKQWESTERPGASWVLPRVLRRFLSRGFTRSTGTQIQVRNRTTIPYVRRSNVDRCRLICTEMLRLQLWRLEKQILSARPRTPNANTRVQLWTTVCEFDVAVERITKPSQGHSLGGAYATILWSALLDQPKMLDSTIRDLVTFGAPRVGDREFVEDLMRVKGERKIWRFVNGADVVPRILYYGVGITYYHPDTLINCFPYSIYRGSTELGPQPPDSWVPQGLKDILKEIYRLVVHSEGKSQVI